ncbi:hypothetical protein JCM20313_09450 [Enterococcus faecalis]|nr:hypothetical protein EsFM111_13660 [Enterococcus sp. FM11-1]
MQDEGSTIKKRQRKRQNNQNKKEIQPTGKEIQPVGFTIYLRKGKICAEWL